MLQHKQNQPIQTSHTLAEGSKRRKRVVRNNLDSNWITRRPQLELNDCLMVELRNEDIRAFRTL
ncbi:hypothetical protein DPMN_093406 [Dreissena polymorpha]|uniref:Uncharacterized protein n=1 Tax=Dreissena polymorpha TaxID=45954 RepID=A0A9D4L3U3_DREPO|nr:hypothetical protein DPMN_093406 [Dreissena polymorpha]